MHRSNLVATVLLAALIAGAPSPAPSQDGISIESLTEIRHPSLAAWSPDGERVAFVSSVGGVQNVWTVGTSAGSEGRAVTDYTSVLVDGRWIEDGPISDLFWGNQGGRIYYVRAGVLWVADPAGSGSPERVWPHGPPAGGYELSPDGDRVAYVRDGDIHVRPLGEGAARRLAETPEGEGSLAWSPEGDRIAFTARPPSDRVMHTPVYSGDKLHFSWTRRGEARVGVVRVSDGRIWTPAGGMGNESSPRWADGDRLAFERITPDLSARELVVADVSSRTARVVHRDDGGAWWSLTYLDAGPHPSPDGERLAFLSDRTGWSHLYVVPIEGGRPTQVTRGEFEVRGVAWSPDGDRIAFSTNRGENPGVRNLEVATLDGTSADDGVVSVTTGGGTNTAPRWSSDGSRLLFRRTSPEHPVDLFVAPVEGDGQERLTVSLPGQLRDVDFVEPEHVTFEAPDGSTVPAYLFTPQDVDGSEDRPAIVWIHGDGVNQNYDGWHIEREYSVYYSMHQYLLQQGYVVLAVDYRGSIGYGREWREGHYRDLGGKDYRDVAAGVEFLETLDYVDTDRVGVWGLSYGGFLTLQALTVTPELFACGVDVAGVVDWRMWYRETDGSSWIRGRMGRPPENPELYDRTAPVRRVDRIERPLAVLHGTADVNVDFIESVRLVDELVREGIPVDFEMYPGEYHYFTRASVLGAAWSKVDDFFGGCLRP